MQPVTERSNRNHTFSHIMNSCILAVEIIQDPQFRYTSDTQTPIAEMMVQFPGLRSDDPPAAIKVIGWGNLAQEIQEKYHSGDRILIEGRLNMNTVDRPEGFKEKLAELTAQRIHAWGGTLEMGSAASPVMSEAATAYSAPTSAPSSAAAAGDDQPDYDDIPF